MFNVDSSHFYWMSGIVESGEVVLNFSGVATKRRITLCIEWYRVVWIRIIKNFRITHLYNYSFTRDLFIITHVVCDMLNVLSFFPTIIFIIFVELTAILWHPNQERNAIILAWDSHIWRSVWLLQLPLRVHSHFGCSDGSELATKWRDDATCNNTSI